jgi:hypothetical protein
MACSADAFPRAVVARAAFVLSAVLLAPQFVGPARGAAEVQQPQPASREAMLAVAAEIVGAAPRLATIWPGYWPPDQPFIIYVPSRGALLISTGERPASFQPLPIAGLPDALKGRAFWHNGSLPDVRRPFIVGYPIGSGKTAILVNAAEANAERITSLLLHEQFHGYQEGAFKGRARQFVDPLAIKDRVAFAVAAETERRVLIRALEAETPKTARELLRHYFALRREREATMPAEAVKVEGGYERIEGTATYVERTAWAMIAGEPGRLRPLLVAELQKPLALKTGAFATHWFRGRGYGTGAAVTYLLSRMGAGDWRSKLEGGATPDEILESLVKKPDPRRAAALAKKARASVDQEAIRRELEPVIRAGEKAEIKSVQEFLATAPYLVVLEAKAAGTATKGFSASGMTELAQGTLALPKVTMFNYSAPAVSLSARNLPILLEGDRVTLLAPSAPRIAELISPAPGEHRLNSATIRSDGIELKIDRPVLVTITGNSTTIRVTER